MAAFYRYVNYGYSRLPDEDSDDEMAMEPDDYDEPPDPPRIQETYVQREEKTVMTVQRCILLIIFLSTRPTANGNEVC